MVSRGRIGDEMKIRRDSGEIGLSASGRKELPRLPAGTDVSISCHVIELNG